MDIQVGFGWLSKGILVSVPLTSLQNEVAVLLGSSLIMGAHVTVFRTLETRITECQVGSDE